MEEQAPFGKPDYELPSYLEKVQSQLPALHLLMQLGWQYLTPEETVRLRGERLGATILEPILVDRIRTIGDYQVDKRLIVDMINVGYDKTIR